jgi:hypothetical protein
LLFYCDNDIQLYGWAVLPSISGYRPSLTPLDILLGTGFYIFGTVPANDISITILEPISMTVDGGQPILGNDITSFSPHTPNISYGAVTNLQLGKHQVVVAPGARTSSVFSYIFVRHLLLFSVLIANY